MTAPRIAIVLGYSGPGRLSLLTELGRIFGADWLAASLSRGVVAGRRSSNLPVLEVGSSSRIRGAGYAIFRGANAPAPSALVELGRSEAAYWGLDDFEPYRVLAETLPAPLPGAQPDASRPWVLVDDASETEVRAALSAHGLEGAQLHALLPTSARFAAGRRDVVRWLERPSVTAALLGRAALVITSEGPLAWDAARVGRTVERIGPSAEDAANARLAATLPPVLLGDRAFLRGLVAGDPSAAEGRLHDLSGRAAAIEARLKAGEIANPRRERAKRRMRKLREEPLRFLSDSRYGPLRRAGKLLERSGLVGRGK